MKPRVFREPGIGGINKYCNENHFNLSLNIRKLIYSFDFFPFCTRNFKVCFAM